MKRALCILVAVIFVGVAQTSGPVSARDGNVETLDSLALGAVQGENPEIPTTVGATDESSPTTGAATATSDSSPVGEFTVGSIVFFVAVALPLGGFAVVLIRGRKSK